MNIIHQITLSELNDLSNKVIDIKASLESNQKLIITLDTETTGKYYNKFQIENTSIDIVDKIIEFGAIFSIENIDNFGFKTIIPILDEDNKDLGFRIFVNPFIDNHKPFHLSIPEEAFNVHNISLGFLEGKEIMECSDEQLFEPAPSLLQNYIVDDSYSTSYIKLIMKMINTSNKLVAHNSNFDVGMINEAVNDYNKLNEYDKLNYCGCEILDTLALFKDVFPKEKLIAIQKENAPIEINHKLDYLMYLAGIEKRSVHGAYWDSKLLIDSYAILLDKYLKSDYMKNIVEKQTTYLSKMNLTYLNNEFIFSLDTKIESYFFEKLYDETFLDFDTIKTHLTLQLSNINKQKRNIITDDQIDLSIVYYKVFINNNKDINTISKFKEKVEKMSTKAFVKLLPDIKKSKAFSQEEINNLIALNSESELFMSHYLTQAIFYYFENKLEEEVIIPKVKDEFKKLNELSLFTNNKEINISKNQMYNYFRTDGSIATKDNNLTTIVGSISNIKKYFKEEIAKGNNKVICMDFNSIVNYIKVEKYVKAFNEESETKIEMNYGLTTLLKINIEDIKNSSNTDLSFLPNEIDFEINIIANNNNGIRLFPQILAKSYSDKYENEDSYKDPYITLEYFTELNNNKDLTITLGSYKGLIEKVLFELPNFWNKNIFILSILNQIKLTNDSINIEMYNSDVFLYDYKLNLLKDFENINYIYTNPNLYLKGDYDLHEVRCNKYNDKIYKLNNLDVFNNFKTIDKQNNNFITLDLEVCSKFPQDKVNIPGLIEDLNFIKRKRPNLYIELENILDEDGNKFDLNNNEKENVLKIQQRYFTLKAREHLIKRFETNNITEDVQPYYNKRFEFELDVINKMKFDGYTLLVDDFLRTLTCVIGGLIGPGRGSAAGSLVSWAYGITNVDPMLDYLNQGKHLLFERYLNPERVSLPDIDMDMNGLVNKDFLLTKLKEEYLNDETIDTFINIIENKYKDEDLLDGKGLIEDYQISLYGVDKVAKIVTRGTYQAKSAIAAVCEFLGNDFAEDVGFKLKGTPYIELTSRICGNAFTKPGVGFNEVLDETSKFFNPYFVNLYNSNANVKKVVDLARKLEGSISNYGVHAAGVLILDPKNNYLNNGYMIIGGVHVSVLDGKFVEDYINIKFDFLGLASLEEIDKTLQFIEKTNNKDIRDSIHYTINNEYILYNDEETYKKVFDIQNTKKIFQFSSDGMQDLVKRVEPKVFEDLVAITALYRPGPMESGMVDMYVRNKRNPELIFYPFKELEIALEPTYGTCLVGNTLITTKDGKNIKIKDIVDNNMVGLYVLSLNEKTNKLEYKKITKTFNNGKKDTFKITTKNGYYIEATKEHKFFTNRGWIKLKDLTKDDFLALPKKHIEIENNEISINNNKLLILAYLLADGYLSKSGVAFINKEESLLNNFKNSVNSTFNNIKFIERKRIRDVVTLMVTTKDRKTYNSNELINWIKELGLFYKRSHEKFIPDFVFDLSKEDILYFLAKYWECDGHISKNGCHIKTISEDICYSIQKLLLKVGINSSININPYQNEKRDNQIAYSINISPFNFKKISKYINSRKGSVEINYANDNVLAPIDKVLIIDYINNQLKEKNISKRMFTKLSGVSSTIFSNSITNKQHPITINTLIKINKILNNDLINSIINNDIYFTKIKNIEIHKTKTEVYDIEVEDNHNFFGNNILVHNCVYQEQVMKIVQVLGGFSLGGADLVRRAMGKKIKEELDKLKGQFIEGTIETYKDRYLNIDTIQQMARINEQIIYIDETNNISLKSIKEMNDLNVFKSDFSTVDYGQVFIKDNKKLELEETYITRFLADSLFEDIIKFAGYGFNKSHAYAYTNVSMQMAYLKAHYPLEFFASILVNNSDDVEKLSEYIIDSKKNNIKLLGVDINKSNLTFDIIDDYIIYGLSNIKGVSNKDIKKILQDRDINGEFKSFEDFLNRFICNHNGSYKTIENLIYAGAFDKLDLSIKDMEKFLFFNNLNTLSVTEEKDIYSERLKSKATYLKSLVNSNNKSLFDMDEIPLNDKLINMFNLENDKHLLPLLITKLLNTKDSTNVKMFTSKTENSKLKLINELKEHYGYIESVKKNIDNTLDLSLVENKRTFLFKLIDLINNDSKLDDSKVIESIYKNYDKNKSLINLSNIEFENTGSLSNFGSLLNRHYIFSEYEDVEVLNLLKDQFKQEGLFRFRAIVRDVISGKNDKDEVYMTILVIDENEIEQRFYLTQDQIFRYKNNISSGDPIILEIEIKEQKEKFYKKLLSIDVLKESKQWTSDTGFNLPLLSIKDLDQDKIKKNESLKVEFCTLEDIKEDWLISNNNWPGIDEGNKQVVLILIDYKQITTKEGKIYQIITVTDGIGNTSIELLYSNLNLIELDNNKRKPIMIELGKRSNNGYGLGAAYKSEIVYLGNKYIKNDDEENKKSIVRKTTFNEILDGKEHINVYSKGKTLLGRQLSNLADIPTVLMLDNETINFYTVEGCWYFLKIYLSLNIKDYELTKMNGYEAKSYGMEKTRSLSPLVDENKEFFQSKIKEVVQYKILNNENLLNEFINNELPYVHYYNYSGNIKNLPETIWLMDFLNNLKDIINK